MTGPSCTRTSLKLSLNGYGLMLAAPSLLGGNARSGRGRRHCAGRPDRGRGRDPCRRGPARSRPNSPSRRRSATPISSSDLAIRPQLHRRRRVPTHRGRAGLIQHHRMGPAVRLGPGLALQDHGWRAAHRAALPMLLDDGYTRVINYVTALSDGAVDVWRGCFTKNPNGRGRRRRVAVSRRKRAGNCLGGTGAIGGATAARLAATGW
jgi:hypothetical protein